MLLTSADISRRGDTAHPCGTGRRRRCVERCRWLANGGPTASFEGRFRAQEWPYVGRPRSTGNGVWNGRCRREPTFPAPLRNVVFWSEAVMNLNAANGSFRSGLPDNRHSVLPPEPPVRSRNVKRTGARRLHVGHTGGLKSSRKPT